MTNTANSGPPKPPSTPGGGWIILRRDNRDGRLRAASHPYEHATEATAIAEAKALAKAHGVEFCVFRMIGTARGPLSRGGYHAGQ